MKRNEWIPQAKLPRNAYAKPLEDIFAEYREGGVPAMKKKTSKVMKMDKEDMKDMKKGMYSAKEEKSEKKKKVAKKK